MNDLSINEPVKIKVWFTEKEIHVLFDRVLPKLLNFISSEEKRDYWQKFINGGNPYKKINDPIKKSLLLSSEISGERVIENSILLVFDRLKKYELQGLVQAFSLLCKDEKTVFTANTNVPIYPVVIECMSYIKSIQSLLTKYPKHTSEHHGTAHRGSSFKKIVETQISSLEARLEHSYFPINSEDEIKKTEIQLRFLKMTLNPEHSNLPEYFNYAKIQYGIDSEIFDLSDQEQMIFEQLLNFCNGVKSSPQELLKSVMIVLNMKFKKSLIDPVEKVAAIREIVRYIFHDELLKIQQKRNHEIFYQDDVFKPYKIKTILHDIPVYVIDHSKGKNFLQEFMTIGLNAIFGIRNLFDPDAPTLEEADEMYIARNFFSFVRRFEFSREERRVFYRLIDVLLLKHAEGKFPLPKIDQKTAHILQFPS